MRFYTIFPTTENVHLIKDVGMIPYVLHKNHDVVSYIVSYKNGEYPYLESEVKGVKHILLKKISGNQKIDILFFLLTNSRNIDVLQFYHFNLYNILLLNIFSWLTVFRKTKTYLKLDANDDILKLRLRGLGGSFFRKAIQNISVISIESTILYNKLKGRKYFSNLVYLPNGFYDDRVDIVKKSKVLLTVGRIGSYPKNTELLLEAYKNVHNDLNGYKLQIVGPIEKKEQDFEKYINTFFASYPDLSDKIEFTGLITDRDLLNKYYQNANIFVMPSQYEGFALVYLEALKAGCRMILSDITPAYDIVINDDIGYLFKNESVSDLEEKLLKICNEDMNVMQNRTTQDFAYKNFHWSQITEKLFKILSI